MGATLAPHFDLRAYTIAVSRAGIAKRLGGAYCTLLAIAGHADEQGCACPGSEVLATELGCRVRQVRSDIRFLRDQGMLHVHQRVLPQGSRGNVYTLAPLVPPASLPLTKNRKPQLLLPPQPRMPGDPSPLMLRLIALYGHRCLGCGAADVPLDADHVTPRSQGGSNHISNRQPLCGPCNQRKGVLTIDYRPHVEAQP